MGIEEQLFAYHFKLVEQTEQKASTSEAKNEEAFVAAVTWETSAPALAGLVQASRQSERNGGTPIDVNSHHNFIRQKHAKEVRKRLK